MTMVSPSLLSADFADLRPAIEMINESDASMIHLDVMDGMFVPNISFGFPVISSLSRIARKPFDVHLMIVDPERYVNCVRDCGAEIMNVHYEACTHLHRTVEHIHQAGMRAAVTLNPATPVVMLSDIIADLDMVLLMSVNPGFGGQKFIYHTLDKLAELRKLISASGSHAEIEVDGGINLETGRLAVDAGADILVAGKYVFSSPSPAATIRELHEL